MNYFQVIFDNLINGNLLDAQRMSKRITLQKIVDSAQEMGYEYNRALLMGCYLKGKISFQDYCDNNNNTK